MNRFLRFHRPGFIFILFLCPLLFFPLFAQSSFQEKLEKLAAHYEIEIVYTDISSHLNTSSYPQIKARPASKSGLEAYTPIFIEEFQRYPPILTQKINLRYVILCHQLQYGEQMRSGIPAFLNNTLWLDVEKYPWNYLIHTLHHEIYHLMDQKDDGELRSDRGWSLLNYEGFRYGKGGHLMRGSTTALIRHDLEGFLNEYSTSGVEEDKAELYTHFLLNSKEVSLFVQWDPILRKKIKLLKKQLERFCSKLDESFWEQQQKKQTQSSFWREFNPFTLEEAQQNIRNSNWATRRGAVYSLGQNPNEINTVLPLLIYALSDPNENVCLEAMFALLGYKSQAESALPKLRTLCSHPDSRLRVAALTTMIQIKKALKEK